jgi:hypothetical protein
LYGYTSLWVSMEELGYTVYFFAWSRYSSHLSCGARKLFLPLLCSLMVGQSRDSGKGKMHCQGQLLMER